MRALRGAKKRMTGAACEMIMYEDASIYTLANNSSFHRKMGVLL